MEKQTDPMLISLMKTGPRETQNRIQHPPLNSADLEMDTDLRQYFATAWFVWIGPLGFQSQERIYSEFAVVTGVLMRSVFVF